MTGKEDPVGVNKILTQNEYDLAVAGNSEQDKAILILWQLIELAYEDFLLTIDYKINEGNVVFKL